MICCKNTVDVTPFFLFLFKKMFKQYHLLTDLDKRNRLTHSLQNKKLTGHKLNIRD